MNEVFDKIKRYADPMLRGGFGLAMPGIIQGVLIEYLGQASIPEIIKFVETDQSLWSQVEPEMQDKIKNLVSRFGDISWLTAEWTINAVRKDLPAYASLFLGWPEGREWLDRQVKEIHQNIG